MSSCMGEVKAQKILHSQEGYRQACMRYFLWSTAANAVGPSKAASTDTAKGEIPAPSIPQEAEVVASTCCGCYHPE